MTMDTFQVKNDNNRIYFRNHERKSGEDELSAVLHILEEAGCLLSDVKKLPTADIVNCKYGDVDFDVVFNGEEAFIYVFDTGNISEVVKIFN